MVALNHQRTLCGLRDFQVCACRAGHVDLLDDDVTLRREVDRASPLRGAPVAGEHVVAIEVRRAHGQAAYAVRRAAPWRHAPTGASRQTRSAAATARGHPRHRDESFGASRADRVDLALDNRECQTGDEREEDG